jgi:hypothetical protein
MMMLEKNSDDIAAVMHDWLVGTLRKKKQSKRRPKNRR